MSFLPQQALLALLSVLSQSSHSNIAFFYYLPASVFFFMCLFSFMLVFAYLRILFSFAVFSRIFQHLQKIPLFFDTEFRFLSIVLSCFFFGCSSLFFYSSFSELFFPFFFVAIGLFYVLYHTSIVSSPQVHNTEQRKIVPAAQSSYYGGP